MNIRQAWLLALVVFIEVQLPVNGQYLAFPDSNAAWVTLETLGPDPWGEITYYMDPIKQEIVINDTAFIVVHSNPANPGALYDNGFGKIYYHDSLAATTYLIYDYSAQQGDTVNVWATNGGGDFYFWPQIVDTIDIVHFAGAERRRLWIRTVGIGSSGLNSWIEGIGGTGGLFSTVGHGTVSLEFHLLCMSANDTIYYAPDQIQLGSVISGSCLEFDEIDESPVFDVILMAPNPSAGWFTMANAQLVLFVSVYTSTGQEVWQGTGNTIDLTAQPPGVYTAVVATERGRQAVRLVVVR